jgi:PadR family transcriptional regulator
MVSLPPWPAAEEPLHYLAYRGILVAVTPPSKTPNALLHGALDALILKTLAGGPRHGYAIARFIEEATGDAVLVEEGSLYPALYRMERRGWLAAEWGTSELGRRAKLYRLTDAGRERLAAETATWRRFSAGVSKVLLAR